MPAPETTANVELLIRKPAVEVFEAFVDPAITTQFWFTRSTGRLAAGAQVTWYWDMYGVSAPVTVRALEPNQQLVLDFGEGADATVVEWRFEARPNGTTFVRITNSGFQGDPAAVTAAALNATEAFALVLAGAKAWLEHGLRLNLIADKFPDGLPPG